MTKNISDMSFIEIATNLPRSIVGILQDIVKLRINKETFTKENRLFYVGVFMVILAMLLMVSEEVIKDKKDGKKTEIHNHYYTTYPNSAYPE